MSKQLLKEGVWGSQRLRQCSPFAHLAYAFFLPIADHWGRFEWDLRGIWAKTCSYREGITEQQVAAWFAEYEQHGLVHRYQVDGNEYAEWTNYEGLAPSKRFPSQLPEPPKVTDKGTGRVPVGYRQGTSKVPKGYPKGTERVPIGEGLVPVVITDCPAPPSADAEAPEPTQPETSTALVPVPKDLPTEVPWSTEACDDWKARYGGTAPGGPIGKALKPLVVRDGWDRVRPVWQRYLQAKEFEYASAADFAAKYGVWAETHLAAVPGARGAPKETLADRSARARGLR